MSREELSEAERSDLYAAMFGDDETEDGEIATMEPPISLDENSKFVTIQVGASSVRVPTLAYCQALEETVRKQAKELQQHNRQLARIMSALKNHRVVVNKQGGDLANVWRELSSKIDRRHDL